MATINLRATLHIKAEEFTMKKMEEEKRNEGPQFGIRPMENRGGPFKGKEDRSFTSPYGGNKVVGDRKGGRFEWKAPKLVASQEEIVKDVDIAKLLCFPEKTTKHMGRNQNAWCYFYRKYEHDT